MKRLALIAGLLVAVSANGEDIAPISTFTKPTATLHLAKKSDSYKDGSYAIWRGKLFLTGKVTVIFERGIPEGYEPDLVGATFFEPDNQSRKKLPQAIGSFYPLPSTMIWLDKSGAATLRHVVGKAEAQELIKGTQGRYEFPARVTIRAFRTDVECDHRSYSAEVVAIERTAPKLIALSDGGEHGC